VLFLKTSSLCRLDGVVFISQICNKDFVIYCLITKVTNNKVVDLMKSGEKKTFVYMPMLGFIEAADTMEETIKRIRQAEVRQEIEVKKMLRRLKRENPGKNIIKAGDGWSITEAPLE
jgi:uncharacterized protein with ACT and thioredoxin-like domain